ncbi:MAG: DNA sulfur modification protein DndB [Phycisphaerae bacterium]|nr:DNA sulfur modification protein DndB [Phycisphaerae bacterium]
MKLAEAQDFAYSFPAIRGVQAGREFYVTMCPMEYVPRLFNVPDTDLLPELRAQRALNKSRIPAIARYILDNPKSYVFSSLTASIDGSVVFSPSGEDQVSRKLGTLCVPMNARILINDGQHRRAAILRALEENPALRYDAISIVFFVDSGLARSQQMFADLNRYAIRPTKSLGILYDHRDPMAHLAHEVSHEVPVFRDMTEKARSTISNRSRKLFTLSSIYQATRRLLNKKDGEPVTPKDKALAVAFWAEVSRQIPDWQAAADRKLSPSELRADCVHAHGVALQALAIAGTALIAEQPRQWQRKLTRLRKIDWSRSNAALWEGRALIGGRLNKAQNNVILTANVIKRQLGLRLSPSEEKVEHLYGKAGRA